MDDGHVIPGLNEGYTLAGAKVMEWIAGLTMGMISQELLQVNVARSGPLMILIVIATTMGMASARKMFPDEERGLRNACMVALGFTPPGLPAPAVFQPYWSGAPIRRLDRDTYWEQLDLEEIFVQPEQEDTGSIFLRKSNENGEKRL